MKNITCWCGHEQLTVPVNVTVLWIANHWSSLARVYWCIQKPDYILKENYNVNVALKNTIKWCTCLWQTLVVKGRYIQPCAFKRSHSFCCFCFYMIFMASCHRCSWAGRLGFFCKKNKNENKIAFLHATRRIHPLASMAATCRSSLQRHLCMKSASHHCMTLAQSLLHAFSLRALHSGTSVNANHSC